uniref:Cystatin domain-containing protein n=1 Tax=Panagrellus redivivus TaxID=6233 RepID=A0A7E4VRL6_PANRE
MANLSPWPVIGLLFISAVVVSGLLGEREELGAHDSTDDLLVKHLATEALDRINYESEDQNYWKLGKITNGGKKVVGGLSYTFKFEIVKTNCNKEVSQDLKVKKRSFYQ